MSDTTRAMIDLPCSYCGNHHSYSPEMCRDIYMIPVTVTSTCDLCLRLKQAEAREAKLSAECAYWREKAQRWGLQAEISEAREAKLVEAARQALSDLEWIEKQVPKTNMQASILLLRHALAVKEEK